MSTKYLTNGSIDQASALGSIASPSIGFYRAQQCASLLGVSKSTFWLWAQQKVIRGINVPQPIKLSPGVTVWNRSEIHTFCEQLAALGGSTTPSEAG